MPGTALPERFVTALGPVAAGASAMGGAAPPRQVRVLVDETVGQTDVYRSTRSRGARRLVVEYRAGRRLAWLAVPLLALLTLSFGSVIVSLMATSAIGGPIFFLLFGVPLLFLDYVLVARLVNRTRLTVEDGVLSVRVAPLPWLGAATIEVDAVERVSCTATHDPPDYPPRPFGQFITLDVLLKEGRRVALLVTFGNVRDLQPWHGWLFAIDLDAWRRQGATAALHDVFLTTPRPALPGSSPRGAFRSPARRRRGPASGRTRRGSRPQRSGERATSTASSSRPASAVAGAGSSVCGSRTAWRRSTRRSRPAATA